MKDTKPYNKIFFDFDSTLLRVESLDVLGDLLNVGERVKEITEGTMSGRIPFENAFKEKIGILSPTKSDVEKVANECTELFVPGAREVLSILQSLGKEVYIVSSNFHQIILPSAEMLGIPVERIVANEFYFGDDGSYRGFSEDSVLHTQGKREVVKQYMKAGDKAVFIGDSSTDLETKGTVDLFVGYGGVAVRDIVRGNADIFVDDVNLLAILPHILTEAELESLEARNNIAWNTTPTTTLQSAVS